MGNQASVTVDIQAKIVGYQQEIETIKAALKNMRVDTSIGKDLSKSLQMVEKEVDNLSKHMNQRLSSDTQITNFTDKLNQVEETFIRIGQLMSNTSFNDLDLSKIDGEFKELVNDIEAAKAALAEKTESGFKTAVEDSKALAKAFNRLGIDMSTLSSSEIGTTLSKSLENLTTKIEEARGRLKEINQDIGNLKQQQNDLSNKPILQIGDISKEVDKILGSKDELGFSTQINQDAVKQLSDRINNAFNTAKPIAEEKKNEINNILKSIGGSGTKEEVAKHLDELIAKIREVKMLSITGLGGGKTGSQLAEKMFSDIFNESKLDEALAKIRQRMAEDGISEADIEKMIPSIKTNLLENNLKGVQDIIKKNLTDTKKDTEKLITDINNQLEQLGAEQKTLRSEKAKDEYTKRTVKAAQTDYNNIIKQLQVENANLKQRVEALEKTREEKRAEALSRIHGSGRQVENKGKVGFNENIKGAKIYRTELEQVQAKEKLIGKIEGVVQRWFSIYAAVRMVGNAIRSVISTIKELDKTITEIAIVTNMTQDDLWGQMKSYTDMARQYAASISGVYQVSQLYYQQGLQTADVMALTEETLKMARISGLDYAQATDYMTNAVRSFKMEMTDAQNVVDVYSAIAASSATSTSELASAMSKTASSAQAVGASFENTTAMMAVMIEATRESPENIGSAMKSIISRYGEMTADPSKLVDSEGQEMSLNKVDKALQSVGITIQDTNHQFRDFDDVITELAGKWDTLDKNTQRYIATVMAGNRQQSRFLALVSSGERLEELSDIAANSEDTATLQVLKTMDSIEAKTQQLKTSLQSLYVDAGIEKLYKGLLDFGATIIKTFTDFAQAMGTPIAAVAKFGLQFTSLANIVTTVFGLIKAKTQAQIAALNGQEKNAVLERITFAQQEVAQKEILMLQEQIAKEKSTEYETKKDRIESQERIRVWEEELATKQKIANTPIGAPGSKNARKGISKNMAHVGIAASLAGSALSLGAASIGEKTSNDRKTKAWMAGAGSALQGVGIGSLFGPWGMAIGGIIGALEAVSIAAESTSKKIENFKNNLEEAHNKTLVSKNELQDLEDLKKRYDELSKNRYIDADSQQEWLDINNKIANAYPSLISYIDEEGNKIVNLTDNYSKLAEEKQKAYEADLLNESKEQISALSDLDYVLNNVRQNSLKGLKGDRGVFTEPTLATAIPDVFEMFYQAWFTDLEPGAKEKRSDGLFIANEKTEFDYVANQILKIDKLMAQANGNFETFKRLYQETYGQDFSATKDFFNQGNEFQVEDFVYSNQASLAIGSYMSQIESNWDYYTSQLDNFITSQLTDLAYYFGNKQNFDYTKYSVLNDRVGKELQVRWEEEKALGTQQGKSLQEIYENFVTNLDIMIEGIQNDLFADINISDNNKDLITVNKIFEDFTNVSYNYLNENILQLADFMSLDQIADLNTRVQKQIERVKNRISAIINDISSEDFTFERAAEFDFLKDRLNTYFNDVAFKYQEQYLNILQSMINTGNYNLNDVPNLINDILDLRDTLILDNNLNDEQINELDQVLSSADLTSIFGINELKKALTKLPALKEKIDLSFLIEKIIPNLTTELDSFSQTITTKIADFEKALSNATKGMDLKTATEMAQKLGKSLSDFDFKDGKFFFDDFAAIRDTYLGENEQYIADLTNKTNEQIAKLSDISKITIKTGGQGSSKFFAGSFEEVKKKLNNIDTKNALMEQGFNISQLLTYYSQYLNSAEKETQTFVEYVQNEMGENLESNIEVIENYTNDQIARAALSTGNFTNFLNQVLPSNSRENAEKRAQLQLSLTSGNIDSVLASFPEYASDILKYYQDINKNVYNKLISGLDSQQYINADEFSAETLQSLEIAGLVEKISGEGSTAIYKTLDKMTSEQLDLFAQTIANSNLIKADKDKMLASIHTEKYEDNIYEGLSGVVDNFDKFSYEAGQKLANSLGTSVENLITDTTFKVDKAGNLSIEYAEIYSKLNEAWVRGLIDNKQFNELSAKLSQHKTDIDTSNIIRNIISNRDKITEENIGQLANALNKTYGRVIQDLNLQQNDDGTYRLNIVNLWNNFQKQMNDTLRDYVASEIDSVISSMTGLAGSQSKGYTDLASMQAYIKSLNQMNIINGKTGEAFTFNELFEYNDSLRAYQLSTEGIIAQISGLKNQINFISDEQFAAKQKLMQETKHQFADLIDADSLISAIGTNEYENIKNSFIKTVEDYNAVLQAMASPLKTVQGFDAEKLISNLEQGGMQAIEAMRQIAEAQGKQMTAEQAEAVWRSEVGRYVNAIDTLVAKRGEIVDSATAEIINEAGGFAAELGNSGTYLVQKAADLYKAYKYLLDKMRETGEATLADLNKVAGLMLDNKDGQQIAIDALGDAANLTYSRLGEIFTSAGKLMTEELIQDWTDKKLIKSLGGNKIQITDFAKFADLMGFDTGSPEYISAFKTYNDSLIEMNRKAEKNILEEAQGLKDMKAGDWIDLTQLSDKLNNINLYDDKGFKLNTTILDKLNINLNQYGAYLENGILKTVNGANIPSIIQEIANNVQQYGNLSELELAQLADTLKEVLKSYADLISGAIKGSLSNEGAQQLSQWSESLGLGKLNFQETTQGLKLATDQAYKLYQEISKIDDLQGRVVFDNLVESLRADKGGDFSSATATMAATARVQQQINDTAAKMGQITARVSGDTSKLTKSEKDRLAVLQRQSASLRDQLNTYNQLAQEMAWSNMDNPDSYNFMNRDLPNVTQGPINYWNSVGEAFGAMREAGSTGKMEIQDFYNIVTEMNNLAAATGTSIEFMGQSLNGDLTNAANLIEAGFGSLSNVDGKGVQVDMGKLAANLQTGATDMGKGFDTAIKEMADSQVHMLDGMIKLMETIVAMEQLGQVDVDNNGILNVDEIFGDGLIGDTDWHQYSDEFDQVREYLLNTFEQSEELAPLLDNLKVSGIKLRDLFNQDQTTWREAGISEQQYAQIMTAFYQAASSDNYDLDNLISSVMNVLSGSGQVYSYYDEETGVETVINAVSGRTYTVNWDDEKDKQRIYDAFTEAGYKEVPTDEKIRAILDKGHAGELTGEALIAYEITYGIIKEYTVKDDEGNEITVWKDSYGNTYNSKEEAVIGNVFAKQRGEAEGDRQEIIGGPRDNLKGYKQSFKIESGFTYDLTVGVDGSEKYETTAPDGAPISGKTYQEMIDNLLNHVSQNTYEDDDGNGKNFDDLSESEQIQLKRKLGITVTPEVIFTNKEGNEVDPANDPAIRTELVEFFNHSDEEIRSKITELEGESGNYEITLYDGSKIQVKAKNEEQALQKIQDALDPLTTSISTAITRAFTVTNEKGGNAVQEAISTAIRTALGIGQQTGADDKNNGVSISSITLSPQGLTIDLSSAGEPTLKGAEEETQDIPIAEVTLKPATVNVDVTKFDAEPVAQTIADAIQTALNGKPITPNISTGVSEGGETSDDSVDTSSITSAFDTAINSVVTKVGDISKEAEKISADKVTAIQTEQNNISTSNISNLKDYADNIDPSKAQAAKDAINAIPSNKNISIGATITVTANGGQLTKVTGDGIALNNSKRRIQIAKTGNVALAAGRDTLMGELGPELVVSHGRYFIVGQNGPEMVNLAEDAIVFNHIQTRQLLSKGRTSTHATPVTNERKATSLATGNVGPAMASASDALAVLKQLRAMWQSLSKSSLKDLGALAGAGGGGGDGGGKSAEEMGAVVKEVEKWYNWLEQIEETQNEINKLSKEYTLLEKRGASTSEKLANLEQQRAKTLENINTKRQLAQEQRTEQATKAKNAIENTPLGAFFKLGENNRLLLGDDETFMNYMSQYNPVFAEQFKSTGKISVPITLEETYSPEEAEEYNKKNAKKIQKGKLAAVSAGQSKENGKTVDVPVEFPAGGLALLTELQKIDAAGNPAYNAATAWQVIEKLGFSDFALKDASGKSIDTTAENWQENAVQNFYEKFDTLKDSINGLGDSAEKLEEEVLDDENAVEDYNQTVRDLTASVQGVVENLDEWYDLDQKIASAQNRLNLLTAEYNGLQQDGTTTTSDLINNLHEQYAESQKTLEATREKQAEQEQDLAEDRAKLEQSSLVQKGLWTFDENGRLIQNDAPGSFKQNFDASLWDALNANAVNLQLMRRGTRKDEKGVEQPFEEWFTESFDVSSFDNFIKQLTATDAYGNSKYNKLQQAEAFWQAGLLADVEKINGTTYDISTEEGAEEAVKAALEYFNQHPEEYNQKVNTVEEGRTKTQEEINHQKELNHQILEQTRYQTEIIDHLDEWYNISRDIADAQNELNLKTAQYDNLTKKLGDNSKALTDNLRDQVGILNKELINTENELIKKQAQFEKDKNKLLSENSLFFVDNGANGIKYADSAGLVNRARAAGTQVNNNQALISLTRQRARLDANGNLIQGENGFETEKYQQNITLDLDPAKLVQELSSDNFSIEEIGQILKQLGLDAEVAKAGGYLTLEGLTKDEVLSLYRDYLSSISKGDTINQDADELKEQEKTLEEIKGKILDANNEIRESLKETAAVTDHLENWYEWTQKIAESQYRLNKITEEYNQLLNRSYTQGESLEKLEEQRAETEKRIALATKDRDEKQEAYNKSIEKLNDQTDAFAAAIRQNITIDEDGRLFYNNTNNVGEKLNNTKLKNYKQEYDENGREIRIYTDENKQQREVRYGDEKYDQGVIKYSIEETSIDNKYEKGTLAKLRGMSFKELRDEFGKQNLDGSSYYKAGDLYSFAESILGVNAVTDYVKNNLGKNSLEDLTKEEREKVGNDIWQVIDKIIPDVNAKLDTYEQADLNVAKENTELQKVNRQLLDAIQKGEALNSTITAWYETTRQINEEQRRLNQLATEYDGLTKSIGDHTKEQAKNLKDQYNLTKQNIETSKEELKMREEQYKQNRKNAVENSGGFLAVNSNGDLVRATSGKVGNGAKTIKYDTGRKDVNGNILYDIFEASGTPSEILADLMDTDAFGRAKYSDNSLVQIVRGLGLEKEIAGSIGFRSFEGLDQKTIEDATRKWLESQDQVIEKTNQEKDGLEDTRDELKKDENSLLDINNSIKELSDIAAGLQNPFEEWHSWLRKIKLEQDELNTLTKEYNILDKTRKNNGESIANNLLEQLDSLQQQEKTNREYLVAREKAQAELLDQANWTEAQKKLFKVENGRFQYNDDEFKERIKNTNGIILTGTEENGAYSFKDINENISISVKNTEELFKELTKQNADNSMKYNIDQQFEILRAFNFEDLMQFDTSGQKIFANGIENATKEEREAAVKALFDNSKGIQEKIEKTEDDIQDLKNTELDLKSNVIDIKNQIQDNEVELENKILQAIEDREQKRIDELKEQKDMLSEAANNFLDGLNEQLDKEKKMYERQENQDELNKLQRQLAILQRSGGSASQINSLQEQIRSKQQDTYFQERQDQIDAVKEASDRQIEKLDKQIEIAEETLAYNKENGLLWNEVREIMKQDSNAILSFINENLKERQSQSSLQSELAITDDGKIVGKFVGVRGQAFKAGGLIDYTGPAWVDGSKQKPESVLNAAQTEFLREQLLDSLENFSLSINKFNNNFFNSGVLNNLGENSGINIERLDFVMKVDSINNDYDARRAGQQAFEEMVRIARKAGNHSVSRR